MKFQKRTKCYKMLHYSQAMMLHVRDLREIDEGEPEFLTLYKIVEIKKKEDDCLSFAAWALLWYIVYSENLHVDKERDTLSQFG